MDALLSVCPYSLVDEHLGFAQLTVLPHKDSMIVHVLVFTRTTASVSPGMEHLVHVRNIHNFLKKPPSHFPKRVQHFIIRQQSGSNCFTSFSTRGMVSFLFIFKFYLFIFGCAASGLSLVVVRRGYSLLPALASYFSCFSYFRGWPLGCWGFSSYNTWA